MIKYNCTEEEFDEILKDKLIVCDWSDERSREFWAYNSNIEYAQKTDVEIVSPSRTAIFTIYDTNEWIKTVNGVEVKSQLAVSLR